MTSNKYPKFIRLVAVRDDGREAEHRLGADCGVLVGSSSTCGFSLQGERLAGFHCMISEEEGAVWVQDWASGTGTFVNGQAIESRTMIDRDSSVRIGDYVITIAADPSLSHDAPLNDGFDEMLEGDGDDSFGEFRPARVATNLPSAPRPPLVLDDAMFAAQTYDRETVDLLRAEIETLQQSLAQRDAELASLLESRFGDDAVEDSIQDDATTDAMLHRIDVMIEEAASRDQREALLQDLLRAAEEANQAEGEERRQLESWVGDLEYRLGQRNEQHEAELDQLKHSVREAQAERDTAAERLRAVVAGGTTSPHLEESLARLEQTNQKLRSELMAMRSEIERSRAEQQKLVDERDQAMREERIQLAQERAVISRLRSDLAAKLADAEKEVRVIDHADQNADVRTRALREHLREIHAQEQLDAMNAPVETLAARVSRLWKRV